ncbi:hypothetical protein KTD31_00080 [Burkholderia multivorans]|uniref:hypothetical protein n=1 Tax=Burkholderia multivorans TaxID=87883 RepID=UPI001C210D3F|nr:hypothetical protein [Burkholderia multivorans]MBU9199795.1 hypothetical protein [Burkholderia multivorans]MDN8079086.1 hypothetical protein [Burkholderia multivorans]
MRALFSYTKPDNGHAPHPRQGMTNSIFHLKATHFAASLLLGGAVGFLSLSAQADQGVGAQPVQAPPPQLAMTQPAPLSAADAAVIPKVQTFQTAPDIQPARVNTTAPASAGAASNPGAAQVANPTSASAAGVSALQAANAPWVLESNTHPWVLNYIELLPLNGLYFTLPNEKDARIMLPGRVEDAADQARTVVGRYITNNIGAAAQIRGRQLEAFNNWADNIRKQKAMLPKDPWAAYQFNKEARAAESVFRSRIESQSQPQLDRMAQDIRTAVSQITPVMNAMGDYDQKMRWYNVLVQLRDGMSLYQTRVTESDRQLLDAMDEFENENPVVPQPSGGLPPTPEQQRAAAAEHANPVSNVNLTDAAATRTPAKAPANTSQPSSSMGGVIVIVMVGIAVLGLFMKLRQRVSKKGGKEKTSDS